MILRRERREHVTFALIRHLFEPDEHTVEDAEPVSGRLVYIALAIAGCAIVLYSLYFGLLAR